MDKQELLDVFNAEPTKLTKEELISLGGFFDVKLTMRQKEATMIKKITEALPENIIIPADEPEEIEVEVVEPKPEPEPVNPQAILGRKPLEATRVYTLSLAQRTALRAKGQSVSEIPSEMNGKQLMKHKNWKILNL